MPQIFLSVGSNINRHENIQLALDALAQAFGFMRISSVYQTQAVGFKGQDFYNLVIAVHTQLSPAEINVVLKDIEHKQGRSQKQKGFVARTIDIDLLTYGDYIGSLDEIVFPRDEILKYAFVLLPLVEVAGEQFCPGSRKTYAQLWKESCTQKLFKQQELFKLDFLWTKGISLPAVYFDE